ncbi:hypothetical protein [Mesorhizobium sp. M0571]|uniref:hypothetical protein n=1 Tax=Mesorhizobium sp. M0571 TaxID=2956960 RepID=UPI0033388C2E
MSVDVLQKTMLQASGLLTQFDQKGLTDLGFTKALLDTNLTISTDGGSTLKPTRRQTAIPLRYVERIFFFSNEGGLPIDGSDQPIDPFAALDTSRFVSPKGGMFPHAFDADSPKDDQSIGSRLILFPDFTDPGRPGALAAISVHLGVSVAINGHRVKSSAEKKAGDRYDARMLMDLGLIGGAARDPMKNLWVVKDGTQVPQPARGLRFDRIRLRCTVAPYLSGVEISRSAAVVVNSSDLLEFARNGSAKRGKVDINTADPEIFRIHHVPALAALGLPDKGILASREFGFRALRFRESDDNPLVDDRVDKIGWRFELWASDYSKSFLGTTAAKAVVPTGVDAAITDKLTLFAEEQRVNDIGLHLEADRTSRTIITARLGTGDAVTADDLAVTKSVLATLDDCINRLHVGLKWAVDGRPLSMLPRLNADKPGIPWHVVGAVTNQTPSTRPLFDIQTDRQAGARSKIVLTTFEPRMLFDMWAGASSSPIAAVSAKATFARLALDDRSYPRYRVEMLAAQRLDGNAMQRIASTAAPSYQPAVAADEPANVALGLRMAIDIKELLGTVPPTWKPGTPEQRNLTPRIMLGALEITLAEAFDASKDLTSTGLIVLRPLPEDRGADPAQVSTGIDAVLRLPVVSVAPAGEDELQGTAGMSASARRRPLEQDRPDPDAPLLLPLSKSSSDKTISLTLTAQEVSTRDSDHTIGLSLRAVKEEEEKADRRPALTASGMASATVALAPFRPRVLVIEPKPFRVAAVDYDDISGLATPENNEVAVWNASGEGGLSWRVRDDGQIVDLLLPPQVVGEAMEKNRSDLTGQPKDIEPGKPAAARFGSLTVLKIDPTFAETRFREPGWNLRRIMGFALQRSPGARLLDLRLELLYGLLARLRADDVWISEIAGAFGEPPAPLADVFEADHMRRYAGLVNAVLSAEQRRFAVEKLWRERPDDDLSLEDGVSFQIRRRTIGDDGTLRGPVTPLRWPTPGGVPADPGGLIEPDILQKTFSASDHDEESFPGGLSWAFESPNILMRVYERPRSDGGSLRGVHLTALGGYGSQRALFDERKSIVETETTLGRIQRYRLERVGRIACLWHPAKHVVVYERTVVPPAQFYNRPPIGRRQDEHLGRAIPRKVEEYIEIMKPQRRYPEDESSLRACGCVVGAEFKSIKIRVDSSWGSDVRREGWQIPLWSATFRGLRADPNNPDDPANLYPKPQVRLTLACEGDKEVPHEIAEPEKLYFYTSVVNGEDDKTDLWQPVRDVDFCDLPAPVTAQLRTESADLTDAMLPPEPEHIPGFERFTIGLVPSKEAVKLTHGRVPNGPVAALRNVTIARAVGHDVAVVAPIQDFGRELAAKAANVRAEIDRRVGQVLGELEKLDRDTDPDQLKAQARKLLDDALAKVGADKLEAAIKNTQDLTKFSGIKMPDSICAGLTAKLREQVEGQLSRLVIIGGDIVDKSATAIAERLDAAAGIAGTEIGRVTGVLDRAEAIARQLRRDQVLAGTAEARKEALDAAKAATDAVVATVKDIRDNAEASIAKRIDIAKSQLTSLDQDLKADLLELRNRTHADLNAARLLLEGGLDSERDNLKAAVNECFTAVDTALKALKHAGAALDADAIKFAKEAQALIATHQRKVREAIGRLNGSGTPATARRILQALDLGLSTTAAAVQPIAEGTEGASIKAEWLANLEHARSKISALKDAILARIGQVDDGGAIDRLTYTLEGILDAALAQVDKLLPVTAKITEINAKLDTIQPMLRRIVDNALKPIETALTKLNADLDAAVPANPIPKGIIDDADDLAKQAQQAIASVEANLADVAETIERTRTDLANKIEIAAAALKVGFDNLATTVRQQVAGLTDELSKSCDALEGFVRELFSGATAIADQLNKWIGDTFDIEGYKEQLNNELDKALKGTADTIAEIKAAAAQAAARVTAEAEARARQLAGTIQETVRDITGGADLADLTRRADGFYQKGDNALRALRALGDPPKTDSLGFNRPEVAYVFGEAKKLGVDMTPTLALVNRAADQVAAVDQAGKAVGQLLDSFGVRLPMNEIADQLIPEKLKGLSVSDLLPDMGGIDFKGLLQRVGFPDLDDSNAVKIRHGFDKTTMRAWMEADLNVPFGESVPLLSIGPVEIMVDTAKFNSQARLSAGSDGTERKMNGRIFGDWRVVCAGQSILTFRQTGLYFDESGKIDFRIQPDRVEIAEALKFVTDLMAATGQAGGIRIEPFVRGGIPSGVAATLDLVLPPIQTGAFGISDLSLHVLFGVAALPRFEIVSELSVGTRLAPFALNVWILNGGGYLTQSLSYLPTSKPHPLMRYTLDIGIVVGLGIGFSFGVVSGGVWVQVGCSVAFTWITGSGSTTAMRVFLLVRGNVDVAGLITASILLLFEVTYDGDSMIGAGTLSIRVKISCFYTLSVAQHVEYVFAGEKKGGEDGYSDSYC